MAVRRWDPFRDLLGIQNEMNRLFGRTYGPGASAEAETQGSWVPPLDVYETQDRYVITAELAGMTTADIEIEVGVPLGQRGVEDNVLTLRGERKFYPDVPEEAFHRIERRFGPFQRRGALSHGRGSSPGRPRAPPAAAPPPGPGNPTPPAAPAAHAEANPLEGQLEGARAEAAGYLDDLQRLKAEFDNYRKRIVKEQTGLVERASA